MHMLKENYHVTVNICLAGGNWQVQLRKPQRSLNTAL